MSCSCARNGVAAVQEEFDKVKKPGVLPEQEFTASELVAAMRWEGYGAENVPMHDSGERQAFDTGAVRDTAAGKTSFRLISPHLLKEWPALECEAYTAWAGDPDPSAANRLANVWVYIQQFRVDGSCSWLRKALRELLVAAAHGGVTGLAGGGADAAFDDALDRLSRWCGRGAEKYTREVEVTVGAALQRMSDLCSCSRRHDPHGIESLDAMMLVDFWTSHHHTCRVRQRVTVRESQRPGHVRLLLSGEHNWTLGMPISRVVDSLCRHMRKLIRGLVDEDHFAATLWNLMAILHYRAEIDAGGLPPELDDMPRYGGRPE